MDNICRSANPGYLALFNGSYLSQRPTGIGVVARELAAALNPELVPLLDPLGGGRQGSQAIPNHFSPEFGFRGHLNRLLWTQRKLPLLLKASGIPLLLSPLPEAPIGCGVRSVVIAHDLLSLRYPKPSALLAYQLAYMPMVLHGASRVLCNSIATAKEVHGLIKVPANRLEVIRLGFNPGSLKPLGLDREPFFLILGRHNPHKNLHTALRAFALLRAADRALRNDLELRIVGPHDRRYTPKLQVLARELGIAERCHWIPWVSDEERAQLLNRCQALLMVSFWEGFGLPALEAMACGAPVIAANVGALPEVVGDCALMVDPLRPESITAAISQVLRDPLVQRDAARMGPARAAQFRWNRTARQVEQLLTELT